MSTRRATPADASSIAGMLAKCWRSAYRGVVPDSFLAALDPTTWTARLRASLESGSEVTLVVEHHGSVIGLVTYGPCRDEDVDPCETGEVWGLYVAPDKWRQGIGTILLGEAETALRSSGHTEAVAWVFEANARGGSFYEASGYSPDGTERSYALSHAVPAIRYRKTLRPLDRGEQSLSTPGESGAG